MTVYTDAVFAAVGKDTSAVFQYIGVSVRCLALIPSYLWISVTCCAAE